MHRRRIYLFAAVVIAVVVIAVVVLHGHGEKAPAEQPPTAAVVTAKRGSLASTLTVAGQFEPYQVVELHAKVSGYVRWIKVDIGDIVHNGEVLAVLEVPELQDQLNGAQAEVQHTQSEIVRSQSEVTAAQATYSALHAEYTRLAQAAKQKPGLIAEQELDDAHAKDQQALAQIGVAKASLQAMQQQLNISRANNHRYQTLTDYEKIVAPFNGVVTMRYADTGSLIQAGQSSNTQTMPVVRVAQSDLLRLRMPVPESDVPYIQIGGEVQVRVNATGKTFTGKIVRFARSLDPATRTMLTEVDVPNPDLVLSPGMYAETTLQLQQRNDTLIIPIQAVVQNGNQSYVLALDATNHVQKRNVTLGVQTSNRVQITSGLKDGDQVIASGQTNYQAGELVTPRPAFIPTSAEEVSE